MLRNCIPPTFIKSIPKSRPFFVFLVGPDDFKDAIESAEKFGHLVVEINKDKRGTRGLGGVVGLAEQHRRLLGQRMVRINMGNKVGV